MIPLGLAASTAVGAASSAIVTAMKRYLNKKWLMRQGYSPSQIKRWNSLQYNYTLNVTMGGLVGGVLGSIVPSGVSALVSSNRYLKRWRVTKKIKSLIHKILTKNK